jgi:hypothetical protein
MQHEHHTPHPEDISLLEEFKVRMEADPAWAEHFLSSLKQLWSVSRDIYARLVTAAEVDRPLLESQLRSGLDKDTTLFMAGRLLGIYHARMLGVDRFMDAVATELSGSLGCERTTCEGHWGSFFTPPVLDAGDHEGDEYEIAVLPVEGDGIIDFFGNLLPPGFRIVSDEDGGL